MICRRFEDEGLAHYSYLLASERSRRAVVVDPGRDVEPYLAAARELGVRISDVVETHIHADYASGALDLSERAGATLHQSAHDQDELYEVRFPHQPVRDGDLIDLEGLVLRAVHTPGHTPEHLSFLVHEEEQGDDPVRMLTGDFLFVGSVGRPDLLGEDAKHRLAEQLHQSVQSVLGPLPDDLIINPGHGSGSMCGSGMSDRPESTLGRQRQENPFLDASVDRDTFVRRLLDSVPPYPGYYRRMKERNAGGPALTRAWPEPVALEPAAFARRVEQGHVVVDCRHQLAFGGGHVPGALGIGLDPDLSTWAAWVVPYDRPILLVVEDPADVDAAVLRLVRVGLDDIAGYLAGGMDAWLQEARSVVRLPQTLPEELKRRVDTDDRLVVLDVRTGEEWEEGHVPGALHVMGGHLPRLLEDGPPADLREPDRPVAVICASGYRSTVAASVLQAHGYGAVENVPGGMNAWTDAGLPVERPDGSSGDS